MKNRIPLILILCIGILTPIASTLLYFYAPPQAHTASGDILPPKQLPTAWNLTQKWTLLYASDGECDVQCQRRLCQTRQLRRMLPGHYLRVQRVWLRPSDDVPPSTVQVSADCGEQRAADLAQTAPTINVASDIEILYGASSALPDTAADLQQSDYLYLVDPDGNLAMRFPPNLDTYQIRKDLARVLKLARGRKQYH